MCGRELPAQPLLEGPPVVVASRLQLDQHGDFVLYAFAREQNLEFVDGPALPDERFHRTRVDVGPANELHVVPASLDTTVIDVAGPPAAARRVRNSHDEILGAITNQGDEPAPEGRDDALGAFAVGQGTIAVVLDRFLDEMILDDVRSA